MMPPPVAALRFLIDPRGRIDRRSLGLALLAIVVGGILAAPLGPFAVVGVLVLNWVFLSASARRLRDLGAPGRLAVVPLLIALGLGLATIWFQIVTRAFCQGYCASASASDIATLEWLERSAGPIVGWTFLGFTGLLLLIPGRRRPSFASGDLPVASG